MSYTIFLQKLFLINTWMALLTQDTALYLCCVPQCHNACAHSYSHTYSHCVHYSYGFDWTDRLESETKLTDKNKYHQMQIELKICLTRSLKNLNTITPIHSPLMVFPFQLWENKANSLPFIHSCRHNEICRLSAEVRSVSLRQAILSQVIDFIKFNGGYYCSCLNNFLSKTPLGLLLLLLSSRIFPFAYIFAFAQIEIHIGACVDSWQYNRIKITATPFHSAMDFTPLRACNRALKPSFNTHKPLISILSQAMRFMGHGVTRMVACSAYSFGPIMS